MNAQFQRISKRNKKAFLSGQCREIEENNRMGKTRDLFKKIRDTKGTFHAKMGSIGFPGGSEGKGSPTNSGDLGSIPGSGRCPGEGNGNPLQYSCLKNPMDREAW